MTDPKKFDKFSFNNDFFEVSVAGDGARRTKHLPEIEEEITAAQEEGYNRGYTDGQRKTQEEQAAAVSQHLGRIEEMLQALVAARTQYAQDVQAVALTTLRKMLPVLLGHAAEKYSEDLLQKTLESVMSAMVEHTTLTLRLHPSTKEFFEKHKAALPHLFEGKVLSVQPDPSLTPGDCVAEWDAGGLDARLTQTMEELRDMLSAGQTFDVGPEGIGQDSQEGDEEA